MGSNDDDIDDDGLNDSYYWYSCPDPVVVGGAVDDVRAGAGAAAVDGDCDHDILCGFVCGGGWMYFYLHRCRRRVRGRGHCHRRQGKLSRRLP